MKTTNKQIIAIIRNQQEAGVTEEMYAAVRANEYQAWENTHKQILKTQNYWTAKDWAVFCREIKTLLNK